MRRSVITAMHSSIAVSGVTTMSGADMISRDGRVLLGPALERDAAQVVALRDDADDLAAPSVTSSEPTFASTICCTASNTDALALDLEHVAPLVAEDLRHIAHDASFGSMSACPRPAWTIARPVCRAPLGFAAVTYTAADDRYESMTYRRCGRSGLQLPASRSASGRTSATTVPLDTQRAILRRAFDLGVTHFDLANNYGPPYGSAEENFGRMLRDRLRGRTATSS